MNDEQQIRDVVSKWMEASKARDIDAVLELMADDVVFLTPGKEPFGKKEFKETSEKMKDAAFDGTSEIIEMKIMGDFAYLRTFLNVIVTPRGGESIKRSGYTLTILRKESGRWRLARDANPIG